MFQEEYEKLSRSDRAQFSLAVNELLNHQYLLRTEYDTRSQMFKVNQTFRFIENNFSIVEDYLSYIDVDITKVNDEGLIYIISAIDKNHMRFDTVTTLIVYALRSYYEGKLEKAPENNNVLMTSNNLRVFLNETGLSNVNQRLSASTIASALRILDSYNVVCRHSGTYSDSSYSFYIRPTIRYIISVEKMASLYDYLTKETNDEYDSSRLFTPFTPLSENDVRSQDNDIATPVVPKMGVDIPVVEEEKEEEK